MDVVPERGALELPCQCEQLAVVARSADEVHAVREAVVVQVGRQGHRRLSRQVDPWRVAGPGQHQSGYSRHASGEEVPFWNGWAAGGRRKGYVEARELGQKGAR